MTPHGARHTGHRPASTCYSFWFDRHSELYTYDEVVTRVSEDPAAADEFHAFDGHSFRSVTAGMIQPADDSGETWFDRESEIWSRADVEARVRDDPTAADEFHLSDGRTYRMVRNAGG